MKTVGIVILVVALFVGYCVKLAMDKRTAEQLPVVSQGLTYTVKEDRFERGLNRYEIRVLLNRRPSKSDALAIGEWLKVSRGESDTFIVFFDVVGEKGAAGRLDYPAGGYEEFEGLPY